MHVLILVGVPGSGKTTISKSLAALGWRHINQDELGSRRACEDAFWTALQQRRHVVVDRCNIDESQRAHWLRLAWESRVKGVTFVALQLLLPLEVCKQRAAARADHPTLGPHNCSEVIDRFAQDFMSAAKREGFQRVISVHSSEDAEAAVQELLAEAGPLLGPEAALASCPPSSHPLYPPPRNQQHGRQHAPHYHQHQHHQHQSHHRRAFHSVQYPQHQHQWGGHYQDSSYQASHCQDSHYSQQRFPREQHYHHHQHSPAYLGATPMSVAMSVEMGVVASAPGAAGVDPNDPAMVWDARASVVARMEVCASSGDVTHGSAEMLTSMVGVSNMVALPSPLQPPPPQQQGQQQQLGEQPERQQEQQQQLLGNAMPRESKGRAMEPRGGYGRRGGGGSRREGGSSSHQDIVRELRDTYADPRCKVAYDADTDPRVILLFDLNGTLTSHTSVRKAQGVTTLRPGTHHLLRLKEHFRLGIYTSSTARTVQTAVGLLEAAAGGQQLFERRLVLHREHTAPAPAGHVDSGGDPWDTLKPLGRYFSALSRVILIDDDAYKSIEGEASNMLLVPCWRTQDAGCCVLERMCALLLELVAPLGKEADVRAWTSVVSSRLHASTAAGALASDGSAATGVAAAAVGAGAGAAEAPVAAVGPAGDVAPAGLPAAMEAMSDAGVVAELGDPFEIDLTLDD